MNNLKCLFVCIFLSVSINDASGIQVLMNPPITTRIGERNVKINCSFTKTEEDIMGVTIKENKDVRIAYFDDETSARVKDENLVGRVDLQNKKNGLSSAAIIHFKNIQCKDARDYFCEVVYKSHGDFLTTTSDKTHIYVTSPPSKPDSVISNAMDRKVEDGELVSFVCNGYIGTPPGKFIWRKTQVNGEITYYNDIETFSDEIPDNCTSYGTSNITIELNHNDNQAVLECVEESQRNTTNMATRTTPITVICPPQKPEQLTFNSTVLEAGDHVTFVCKGQVGNPPGSIVWKQCTPGGKTTTVFPNTKTVTEKRNDSCSFYSTSSMSMQLTHSDHNSIIVCVIQSQMTLERKTTTYQLNVFYGVSNISIRRNDVKHNSDNTNLTCHAEGNPPAKYTWYTKSEPRKVLSFESVLLVSNSLVNKTYVCIAFNSFSNETYNITGTINMGFVDTGDYYLLPNSNSRWSILKFVAIGSGGGLVLCIVILVIIASCHTRRSSVIDISVTETEQIVVDKSTNTVESEIQLATAYASVMDARKLLALPNIDFNPYADIADIIRRDDGNLSNGDFKFPGTVASDISSQVNDNSSPNSRNENGPFTFVQDDSLHVSVEVILLKDKQDVDISNIDSNPYADIKDTIKKEETINDDLNIPKNNELTLGTQANQSTDLMTQENLSSMYSTIDKTQKQNIQAISICEKEDSHNTDIDCDSSEQSDIKLRPETPEFLSKNEDGNNMEKL